MEALVWAGVDVDAQPGVNVDARAGVDVDARAGVDVDARAGVDVDARAGVDVDVGARSGGNCKWKGLDDEREFDNDDDVWEGVERGVGVVSDSMLLGGSDLICLYCSSIDLSACGISTDISWLSLLSLPPEGGALEDDCIFYIHLLVIFS